jgi:S-adenosylmethionine:tRNA ribosyltransferase-isomerase
LLKRLDINTWEVMAKPARKLKTGEVVEIPPVGVTAVVIEEKEEGIRIVRFSSEEMLFEAGEMPLPPYIHKPLDNGERYQTVYSKIWAARQPRLQAQFTPGLLQKLQERVSKPILLLFT